MCFFVKLEVTETDKNILPLVPLLQSNGVRKSSGHGYLGHNQQVKA